MIPLEEASRRLLGHTEAQMRTMWQAVAVGQALMLWWVWEEVEAIKEVTLLTVECSQVAAYRGVSTQPAKSTPNMTHTRKYNNSPLKEGFASSGAIKVMLKTTTWAAEISAV